MLIQSLIETADDVDRAAAHQARLEKLMVEAGGIAGPGSIGNPGRGGRAVRQFFPVDDLARDERFNRVSMRDRMADPRSFADLNADQSRRSSEPAGARSRETRPTRPAR